MARKRDKLKAIQYATEIRTHSKTATGVLIDLMMPVMHTSENHCRTCQCRNYITYTGFSVLIPFFLESALIDISKVQDYAKSNLDKVIEAP